MSDQEKNNPIWKIGDFWAPHARILNAMPRFQSRLKELRPTIDLPPNGLPRAKRADWVEKQYTYPTFDFKNKYGVNQSYSMIPHREEIIAAVEAMLKEFNLSHSWAHSVYMVLVNGGEMTPPPHINAEVIASSNSFREEDLRDFRITDLHIRITKYTTQQDIQDQWNRIKKLQSYMLGPDIKKRVRVNDQTVEKYVRATQLRSLGNTWKIVASELGFETEDDARLFVHEQEKRFTRGSQRSVPPHFWQDL